MKVYLASWFASIEDMRVRAQELQAEGIAVTSRWLDETYKPKTQISDVPEDYLRQTGGIDVEDILEANVLMLNTPTADQLKDPDMPIASWARGGRHFESGIQYATMLFFEYLPVRIRERGSRYLILVGRRENVFHFLDDVRKNKKADGFNLPEIKCFETWEDAKAFLVSIREVEHPLVGEYF